jgi:hypothetical protein
MHRFTRYEYDMFLAYFKISKTSYIYERRKVQHKLRSPPFFFFCMMAHKFSLSARSYPSDTRFFKLECLEIRFTLYCRAATKAIHVTGGKNRGPKRQTRHKVLPFFVGFRASNGEHDHILTALADRESREHHSGELRVKKGQDRKERFSGHALCVC